MSTVAIDPSTRLRDCPEDQINVSIARPLNGRLDALLDLAIDAGENTSRRELLAALILAAPETGAALSGAVRSYRSARAEDAAIQGQDLARFLDPPRSGPGPRGRRKA